MGDGLLIVYTGGGKGKTTAALGLALRAAGYGRRICMVQFIKGSWHSGEIDSHKRLMPEFEIVRGGEGFVGIIDDKSPREDHERAARATLEEASSRIRSGKYDVVILDEINYAAQMGLVSVQDVLDLAGQRRPGTDLVLTGNHAAPEVVEAADLVTEMREVKHPFQRGIPARKGIDF